MFLYYKYLILMLLYFWKAGENKIFHFIYFCFFVSSHDFELSKLFILAPPKCENCFKLVARVLRFETGHGLADSPVFPLFSFAVEAAWPSG